jgi:Icc-related predicted phosphoesterase
MKIVAISDTHSKHKYLTDDLLGDADMIICAGDISTRGGKSEVIDFLNWYSKLPYQYKILIAGNHDFIFEQEQTINSILEEYPNIIYINDSGITINDIKIWGSPIQPYFHNWAFNRIGTSIIKHWDLIPQDTDILVTHGPPMGILDKTIRGAEVGCPYLLEKVNIVKPKFHIFGHIHEAFGQEIIDNTHFINASVLDVRYNLVNHPIYFNI